jgi:hypothetical protein
MFGTPKSLIKAGVSLISAANLIPLNFTDLAGLTMGAILATQRGLPLILADQQGVNHPVETSQ